MNREDFNTKYSLVAEITSSSYSLVLDQHVRNMGEVRRKVGFLNEDSQDHNPVVWNVTLNNPVGEPIAAFDKSGHVRHPETGALYPRCSSFLVVENEKSNMEKYQTEYFISTFMKDEMLKPIITRVVNSPNIHIGRQVQRHLRRVFRKFERENPDAMIEEDVNKIFRNTFIYWGGEVMATVEMTMTRTGFTVMFGGLYPILTLDELEQMHEWHETKTNVDPFPVLKLPAGMRRVLTTDIWED